MLIAVPNTIPLSWEIVAAAPAGINKDIAGLVVPSVTDPTVALKICTYTAEVFELPICHPYNWPAVVFTAVTVAPIEPEYIVKPPPIRGARPTFPIVLLLDDNEPMVFDPVPSTVWLVN
jgi:hypothetical protein